MVGLLLEFIVSPILALLSLLPRWLVTGGLLFLFGYAVGLGDGCNDRLQRFHEESRVKVVPDHVAHRTRPPRAHLARAAAKHAPAGAPPHAASAPDASVRATGPGNAVPP
jgi:hypothetical protein